ncbi:MAG: hypothetical protein L6R38_001868 [Xanthoria sp. 2 TBL-2021]|nr:MAG: hypothetical protein L6R38_001868 [Xanthoria sp. 2 TBL-2021]
MSDQPDPEVITEGALSVRLPNTETASFESEQLHDLAILRVFGRFAMSLITKYLNKQYGREWNGDDVVRVWRKLRQEQEKDKDIFAGQVLYVWREEYRDTLSDSSKMELFEEIKKQTFEHFFDAMSEELNDSDFTIDVKLDFKAGDNVTVLSSKSGGFGALAREKKNLDPELFEGLTLFKTYKGLYTTDENNAAYLERRKKAKAWKTDTFKWTEKVIRGVEDPGPKPSKLNRETLELDEKYYYRPKPPKF